MSEPQHRDAPGAPACGCSDDQIERIHEYLDGALTVQDVRQIAEHLDACPDCTREHDLERVIRSAVRRSCAETAPQTLRAAIITRIQQTCGEAASHPSDRRHGT